MIGEIYWITVNLSDLVSRSEHNRGAEHREEMLATSLPCRLKPVGWVLPEKNAWLR